MVGFWWDSGGILTGFWWDSGRNRVGFRWDSDGILMGLWWDSGGILVVGSEGRILKVCSCRQNQRGGSSKCITVVRIRGESEG